MDKFLYHRDLLHERVKGYLRYKTIFCHKVDLDAKLMNFFIWSKNVSFSRYQDFCVFVKSTSFEICDVIINILHNGSYTSAYLFWILRPTKMKFGQILVYRMKNISNVFLAQC